MKNIIIIIIIVLVIGGIGVLGYLLFFSGGTDVSTDDSERISYTPTPPSTPSDETDTGDVSEAPSEQTESGSEITDTTDSRCPTGLVCLGRSGIATIPRVTLGKDETYRLEDTQVAEEVDGTEDLDGEDEESSQDDSAGEVDPTEDLEISDNTPLEVLLTNKDFRIWTVTWVTLTPQQGYIRYGTSSTSLTRTAYDDRSQTARYTHHVTVANSDDDISGSDPTFYFEIISGGETFDNGGSPYTYENAPLTSSPSSPQSIAVTSNVISGYDEDDYMVVARQRNSGGSYSTYVSDVYNTSGGVDLVIGIARSQSLSSYFSSSSSNQLEVTIYGPGGYTGYVDGVNLGSLEDEVLTMRLTRTDYGISASMSAQSDYTLDTDTIGNVGNQSAQQDLPQTGLAKSWAFTSGFGLVVSLLGICCAVVIIPWNYKKLWEEKVLKHMEQREE